MRVKIFNVEIIVRPANEHHHEWPLWKLESYDVQGALGPFTVFVNQRRCKTCGYTQHGETRVEK